MARKSYTPISGYWYVVVPAVMLGIAYYTWTSHGFLAMRLQQILRPVMDLIHDLFRGLGF